MARPEHVAVTMRGWLVSVLLLLGGVRGFARDLVLTPGVSILVDEQEPAPVLRAVRDLQRDLAKVFGVESRVVHHATDATVPTLVVTCAGAETKTWREPAATAGVEAHALRAGDGAVVLQGADVRGAIYAIYEFSDRFLGVPPLWYWLGVTPPRLDRVAIPADLDLRFAPATVRYRTWFPNDTDMLTPWLDQSPEHYEAMFETLLRLKFNVLDVDYISDLPAPNRGLVWARTCRDRGIMVTSTHAAPFGIRWTPGWEPYWRLVRHAEPPPLRLASEEKFWEFWRYFIDLARRERLEMLWQIAFRGDFDKPMELTFPDAPRDPAAAAALVDRMLRREVAFLKEVTGDPHPPMRAVLFEEVGKYYAAGQITPPHEPSLTWSFGNDKMAMIPYEGMLTREPPADQPLGYYYNLQYTAIGSHLAEAQSPGKIHDVLALVQRRSPVPLGEVMFNVGNVREFPLGLSAASAMLWRLDAFDATRAAEDFCARYFGAAPAARIAAIYRGLFDAYWEVRAPRTFAPVPHQYIFADLKTARYLEAVLESLQKGSYDANPVTNSYLAGSLDPKFAGAATQLDAILAGNAQMLPRLEALARECQACAADLAPAARPVFARTVAAQVDYLLAANRTLNAAIRAAQRLPDAAAVARELDVAARAAEQAVDALERSDAEPFATWHGRAGPHGFRARDYAAQLRGLQQRYAAAAQVASVPLAVMSFNVRTTAAKDGDNGWANRKKFFFAGIATFAPDLIGFQEVMADQHDDIVARMTGHEFVGVARDDGARRGEWALLGFRRERFELLAHGDFWLSATPEIAGSKSWDAALTRICTWARLRDRRTGREFLFANTHFDHKGVVARENSARLLRAKLAALAEGRPIVLTGDLNTTEDDPPYAALTRDAAFIDSFRETHPARAADEASFQGFKPIAHGARIDFIFHTRETAARASSIERTPAASGRLPSDHYAVTAVLEFRE